MGVSLKASARRFAYDFFQPWDATTNAFSLVTSQYLQGRLFRVDRFTSIYHRPTRRSYISFLTDAFPASGVVRRRGTSEVYLLSKTLKEEVLQDDHVYDRLRQSNLATPPSGGEAVFYQVTTSGTGEDLGVVTKGTAIPVYIDLELQGVLASEGNIDVAASKFILNYSFNVNPVPGDYFVFDNRWFLVNTPYLDGGLAVARVSEMVYGYHDMLYIRKQSGGAYNPTTGVVTASATTSAFSGLIGLDRKEGSATEHSKRSLDIHVYERHIGFTPRAGDSIQYDGLVYEVRQVEFRRDELQWKLEVAR